MYKLQLNCPGKTPGCTGLMKLGLVLLLGLAATASWAAPANDNFTNATVINGNAGTITGSNVGATLQPGEPIDAGVGGGKTVWYKWTAPFTGTILFKTEGSSFDTALGVYTGTNVANLTLVAQNDDVAFPSDLTSQVEFPVIAGTNYLISVDGTEGDSGNIILAWQATGTHSAGSFGFAASSTYNGFPLYIVTEQDGTQNARVIRTDGNAGKVSVNYVVTNTFFTNIFITNITGTNFLTTNSDGTYSNVLVTNYFATSTLQGFSGVFTVCSYSTSYTTITTNVNGVSTTGTTGSTNVFDPFGCSNTNLPPGTATNTTTLVVSTLSTNVFCMQNLMGTNVVPSAVPNVDYRPASGTVTLMDYQMATNIPYTIVSDTAVGMIGTNVDNTTLRNHLIVINLSQPALNPQEDTNDIALPNIGVGSAYVQVQNPNVPIGGVCTTIKDIANFVDSVANVSESSVITQRTFSVTVRRTGDDATGSFSVPYTADLRPSGTPDGYDFFPARPGSDYATPTNSTPGSREPTHFFLADGTVTWGAGDTADKSISFTVDYDPEVQFNEDFIIQLLEPTSPPPPDGDLGQQNTMIVTILFNDQPAGAVDQNHNPDNSAGTNPPLNQNPGAGGPQNTVYAAAVQSDNKTVFGGDFLAYNTVPRSGIARMNADGSLDTTFMPGSNLGANGTVSCLALQPDGRIVIGGTFSSFNSTNRSRIARLNTDGSLDLTFNPGVGANGTVWCMALYPQTNPTNAGKVLIGGSFSSVNSTNRNYLARLNPDGSLDTTFDPGVGPNDTVNAIALQGDGQILVGGQFTTIDNTNFSSIARLNPSGSLDTSFNPGLGADQPVLALAEQPDGNVVLGGAFSTVNLTSRNGVARLLGDGSIDLTFDPGSGTDDSVSTLALQPDGNILLGGLFQSINGTRRIGVARLLSNGFVDTSFMDTAYNQFAGIINPLNNQAIQPKNYLKTIALQADGGVIIGGRFSLVGGGSTRDDRHVRQNICRLIGGATPGPGNIGLIYPGYTVDKANEPFFVTMARTNGALGPASVTLSPNPLHIGPGNAVPNVDYAQAILTPTWGTTWGQPGSTWLFSDDLTGQNNEPVNVLGGGGGALANSQITIFDNTNTSGNLGLNLQLTQPVGSLLLGGEPIPTGVALATAASPLTIVDDSVPAGTVGFVMPTNYTVSEGATNATITVIRTNGSVGQITVMYQTVPGTGPQGAQPGATNDYIAKTGKLTFDSGVTNASFTVPIVNNFVVRPDRTLSLILYNATGGAAIGANSNATLTIINDNFLPGVLSFSSPTYITNESAGAAQISVIRLGGSQGTESIAFTTVDGTATNGTDYISTNGVLTWNSGETAPKTFTVPILNSGLVHSTNLTLNLQLSNAKVNGVLNTNASQPPTNAVLTIINDNFLGSPTLSASSYFVNENAGFVVITVNRLGGSSQTITVDYSTSDGTAIGGTDYTPESGTLTFTNGQFSESFTVPIININPQTYNQAMFNVTLSNPTPNSGAGGSVTLGNPSTAPVSIIANQIDDEPSGSLDPTFNANAGFNATVYTLALQGNGSIIAGGDFTSANSIARNRIARLNANGTLDVKFSSGVEGANESVRALAIQTDGQILVGGLFTSFNNANANYLTRLNFDGSLDSTFNTGGGADNPVYGIAETFAGGVVSDPTRKIVIGGSFASVGGIPYRSVAQLNEDGSVDTSFTAAGANATVYAVAVYSTNDAVNAGKILVAGDFTMMNSSNVNYIARLNPDGSLDSGFNNINLGSGPNGSVRTIAIQVDGGVVIGGLFTSVDGMPLNYFARLTPAGRVDPNFNVGDGANDAVTSLALGQDLSILVGGAFTRASDVTRNRLTRLLPNGTVDSGINFGQGANDFVDATVIQPDGKILVGGGFTTFEGQPKPHIARLFGGEATDSGVVQFTQFNYQVNEAATNAVITVQRVGGTTNTITVTATTSDGTALAGVDYLAVTTNLTFADGETFQSFQVPILVDPTNMGQLNVNLSLTNANPPDALGGQSTATLSIVGANSTVSFLSANYAVNKNTGNGAAVITVVRNNSSIGPASVDFMTTTNGTATPGEDYTPVSNTVFFADGQTTNTFVVPVINNGLPEGDLTVGLALLNPTNTALDAVLPTVATLTIVDNSLAPGNLGFSATSYSIPENSNNVVITIIRTNGSVGPVSVNYATGGGTAIPGVNYIATNGSLAFVDGQLSKTFTVAILNSTNQTNDVTVNLTLSIPFGGNAGLVPPATVPLTILNENSDVSFAQAGYFVDEKNGSISIGVNRTGNTNGTLVVQYSTVNGTAVSGLNYVATTNGTLTFPPGSITNNFLIPIIYDPQITGDLVFFVNLSKTNGSPVQLVNNVTTTVTILDDDSGFSLSTNSYSVIKTNGPTAITVIRSGNTAGAASVSYAVSGGTASPNVQYVPTSGVLTFASGMVSNSFNISILNDGQIDSNKTVNIALSSPTPPAQLLSPSNAVLTIIDNESGLSFSSANYSASENGVSATITVERTGDTNDTVSVDYGTSDGSAHAPTQYLTSTGTLTFTNGQTMASFNVPIIDNNVTGGSETVLLLLSNASSTASLINPSAATLTILNNDGSDIIPAGAALSNPAGGTINPGASVTVLLALRNATNNGAGFTATNVLATLLATNHVIPGAQTANVSYGNLVVNGPSVFRPFSFSTSATNANGTPISAVLNLVYDGTNAATVTFNFTLGNSTNYFTNNARIVINDLAAATPYPSVINVSSVQGVVSNATVTLSSLGHANVADVSVLVLGPAGQKELLMEENGGKHTITNVTLTFDSSSANPPMGTNAPVSTTYPPSPLLTGIVFPNATNITGGVTNIITPPPAPYGTNLADFNGSNPNGAWSLYVDDTSFEDTGAINGGWILGLASLNILSPNEDLVLGLSSSSGGVVVSNNLVYTVSITNAGPSSATGVTNIIVLPAGLMNVVTSSSQGTSVTNGNTIVTSLGNLATNGTATITVTVKPTAAAIGNIIATATVTANEIEDNLNNNTAAITNDVLTPSADLGIAVSTSTNIVLSGNNLTFTVVVTNAMLTNNIGGATAIGVMVTNVLPAKASYVSQNGALSAATNGNVVVFSLGNIPSPGTNTFSLVVQESSSTLITNISSFSVGSTVPDPLKGNNTAAVKTVVQPGIPLSVVPSGNSLNFSWPAVGGVNFAVQEASTLAPPNWVTLTNVPVLSGGIDTVTITVGNGTHFFRLFGH